jgi:hypothetical protein
LISYKLSDKNHHCEICPFDQAIKNEKSGKGDFQKSKGNGERSLIMGPSARINGSIFYYPDHFWANVANLEKVR